MSEMNEYREQKEHDMRYKKEEAKSEKHDEAKPAKSMRKKGNGGLINVTLEGSGRSCYPKLMKLNDKPY